MTKIKYTESQLMSCAPCRDGLAFAKACDFDFVKIWNTCERGDWLIWLLRKSKAIDKPQAVLIACECAERVLAIYENKHPKDLRPRQAIEAAREWAKNPTEENRLKCKSAACAAYAAYAAAYAAYAAYAAAYAAYAAAALRRLRRLRRRRRRRRRRLRRRRRRRRLRRRRLRRRRRRRRLRRRRRPK